jgi:hypothetical protein
MLGVVSPKLWAGAPDPHLWEPPCRLRERDLTKYTVPEASKYTVPEASCLRNNFRHGNYVTIKLPINVHASIIVWLCKIERARKTSSVLCNR